MMEHLPSAEWFVVLTTVFTVPVASVIGHRLGSRWKSASRRRVSVLNGALIFSWLLMAWVLTADHEPALVALLGAIVLPVTFLVGTLEFRQRELMKSDPEDSSTR